ncbi:MAG: Glu-tRNA(Gln) amidotransferase subunit GatE [Caldisphaera sp.]|jgi:glutamyl-tRNA(Gln) amidotransferase subunit E|nr:Glu-tRNA(Gln) amidotransferase subunit GatE [Caldisphaera sp.]PMP60894.1 MAG: Glu-tRNA(Gln) amidotransferase GatDE subunit E [Caldisphaera sp.]PMP89279.1 MAG: Glu-tRNA(Gln) amidotransferase GatDE subunit E [Caldisphaera sp.]
MDKEELDYQKLGLKVGLEIHQQLNTENKLFCSCPTYLVDEIGDRFKRNLRPTRSETGEVDIAALFEWRKGRTYEYQAPHGHYCMVEADEEPPHMLNRDAVIIASALAMALNSNMIDEIHTMRKIVIDGSNTAGFQRTAIVALNGFISVSGKKYGIETICIEEDAARKISESGKEITYRLDRLGIPLIEISTSPDMHSPREARDVALAIGRLLRLTGKVKRGLGTIRQDLNVSIIGGAKTEIKGVQKLDQIEKIVQFEVMRQVNLLKIKDELVKRQIDKNSLDKVKPIDLTDVFTNTNSKIIKNKIQHGGKVYGINLRKFKGIIGMELMPNKRFGTELADYSRFWAGVEGIFHSDELPNYGITEEEVEKVFERIDGNKSEDAFIIIADDPKKCLKAIEVILNRIKIAFDGVPEETRTANEDGTTKYMRPRPGKERMYPETDIPPLYVDSEIIREASKLKPESVDVKLKKLIEQYRFSQELAEKVINDVNLGFIEEMLYKYGNNVQPTFIASLFVTLLKGLKSKGVDVDLLDENKIESLLKLIAEGKVTKDAAEDIITKAAERPESSLEEIVNSMGISKVTKEDAEKIICEIINQNKDIVLSKGEKSMSTIMGKAMDKLRGKIDGKTVSEIVSKELKNFLRNK